MSRELLLHQLLIVRHHVTAKPALLPRLAVKIRSVAVLMRLIAMMLMATVTEQGCIALQRKMPWMTRLTKRR